MAAPPPHGMNEADYETIEAAVTETVRGRWFLGEFARRNRAAELRQILDAMARLETVVAAGPQALPPADPSIRLMMQRIKEIAGQLEGLSADMREAGVAPRLAEGVEAQARAVAGLMRSPGRGALPQRETAPLLSQPRNSQPQQPTHALPEPLPAPLPAPPRLPRADLPASMARPATAGEGADPRLAALAALDGLALAQKLSLFS